MNNSVHFLHPTAPCLCIGKYVKYVNYIFFIILTLSSCNKSPKNVRELMESESPITLQEESSIEAIESDINTDDYEIIEEEPAKKYKQCPLCYGTSKCGGCGGGGGVYNSIDYSPGQYVDCSSCNGSGTCGLCEGSGIVEDFGW